MSKKIGKKIWIYVGVGVFLVIVGIISWGVATDWKFIGGKKSGGSGPPPPPPPPSEETKKKKEEETKKKKEEETKKNIKFIILKFIDFKNIEPKVTKECVEENIDKLYQFFKKEKMDEENIDKLYQFFKKEKMDMTSYFLEDEDELAEKLAEELAEEFDNFVKLMRETILICGNYLGNPSYKKYKERWHKGLDQRIWEEVYKFLYQKIIKIIKKLKEENKQENK